MAKNKILFDPDEFGKNKLIDFSEMTAEQQTQHKDEIKACPSPLYEEVLGAVAAGNGTAEQVAWAKEKLDG